MINDVKWAQTRMDTGLVVYECLNLIKPHPPSPDEAMKPKYNRLVFHTVTLSPSHREFNSVGFFFTQTFSHQQETYV